MGLTREIEKSSSSVFRKAFIKRRNLSTGLYESEWLEITDYIKRWGNVTSAIDAIRLNNFLHQGTSLIARNDDGKFNDENDPNSLWNGYLSRYRTLFKIEAGYIGQTPLVLKPFVTTENLELPGNWDLTTNLLAWYKLDDNTATTAIIDSGVNAYNGTLYNDDTGAINSDTRSSAGKVSNSISFDDKIYADFGDVCDLENTDFGVSLWFKASSFDANDKPLVCKIDGISTVNYGWGMFINQDEVWFKITLGSGTAKQVRCGMLQDMSFRPETWYHAAVSVDRSDKMRIFINGARQFWTGSVSEVAINTWSGFGIGNARHLRIGVSDKTVDDDAHFQGLIDNVMIFNKVLTSTEVQYLYNIGSGIDKTENSNSQGVYILTDEILDNPKTNEADIQLKSINSIFNEVRASEITEIGTTLTASQIITKIKNHTDGSSNYIFQQFISSSAWFIQTTTNNYNIATTTSLQNITTWELMEQIAECEGFVVLINREGGFEFRNRNERNSISSYNFYGNGFRNKNIISFNEYKEAYNRYYNYFILEYTSGSFVTAGTTTTVDPANLAWKYGNRIYNLNNNFFQTSTIAQTIVDNLYTEFKEIKTEIELTTKFNPELELLDRVNVSFLSYNLDNASLWDEFNWYGAIGNSAFYLTFDDITTTLAQVTNHGYKRWYDSFLHLDYFKSYNGDAHLSSAYSYLTNGASDKAVRIDITGTYSFVQNENWYENLEFTNLSFSIWLYINSFQTNGLIFTYAKKSDISTNLINYFSIDKPVLQLTLKNKKMHVYISDTTSAVDCYGLTELTTGSWTHLGFVFNKSNSLPSLYLNGVAETIQSSSGDYTVLNDIGSKTITSDHIMVLGEWYFYSMTACINTLIDEFYLYETALSSEDMLGLSEGDIACGNWADETGENISWYDESFKILSKSINLDTFEMTLRLRKI